VSLLYLAHESKWDGILDRKDNEVFGHVIGWRDVTMWSTFEVSYCFRETYHFLIQGQINWARYQLENTRQCFHAVTLLGLFDFEYGGDIFLRNVSWLSADYTVFPEDSTFHNYQCENLKSCMLLEECFATNTSLFRMLTTVKACRLNINSYSLWLDRNEY
jgi:hypothetical protein